VTWNIVGPAGPRAPELLTGSVSFVDALDTEGYVGLGGVPAVQLAPADAGSVMAVGGTISGFRANARSFPAGTVTVTLMRSAAIDGTYESTGITCALTDAAAGCSDTAHTAALAPGDVLVLQILNPTGSYVRNVRWTARYQ
jgi:hypothetical protein